MLIEGLAAVCLPAALAKRPASGRPRAAVGGLGDADTGFGSGGLGSSEATERARSVCGLGDGDGETGLGSAAPALIVHRRPRPASAPLFDGGGRQVSTRATDQ
jgi:hypothetical protein